MGKGKKPKPTRRQHTIPRMLLKRFASRVEGDESFTWQFRRRGKPFENNIRNSSVESYFYGNAANGIEGSFSEIETQHSSALDEILEGMDPNQCATALRQLVWTLAIRTGNFRKNIGDLLTTGVDEMIRQVDPVTARRRLSEQLDDEFDKTLDEIVSKLPAVQARALRISLDRRPALRDKFRQVIDIHVDAQDVGGVFQSLLTAARAHMDFRGITRNAHVRSLGQLAERDYVPDSFRPEHWQLARMPARSLILGDGACFAIRSADDPGHLLRFIHEWSEIYLPISHDAVLVASRSSQPPRLGIEQINRASAALSYDEFFAAENQDQQRALVSHIRSGTATMTPEEMRASARGAWQGKRPEEAEKNG